MRFGDRKLKLLVQRAPKAARVVSCTEFPDYPYSCTEFPRYYSEIMMKMYVEPSWKHRSEKFLKNVIFRIFYKSFFFSPTHAEKLGCFISCKRRWGVTEWTIGVWRGFFTKNFKNFTFSDGLLPSECGVYRHRRWKFLKIARSLRSSPSNKTTSSKMSKKI